MAKNPNYKAISEQLKSETNPTVRQKLIDQLYVFNEPLTEEEKDLFGYVQSGYIENNPGNDGNSYVGNYKDF